MTEDEMVGCHHQFNGHELGRAPGDGEGQGELACCGSWGRKELDNWQLNNNNKYISEGTRKEIKAAWVLV